MEKEKIFACGMIEKLGFWSLNTPTKFYLAHVSKGTSPPRWFNLIFKKLCVNTTNPMKDLY